MYKNWAALELLYPVAERHKDLRQLSTGSLSPADLVKRYEIPEFLVETALGALNFNLESVPRLRYREPPHTWIAKLLSDAPPWEAPERESVPSTPDEEYRAELASAAGGLYSATEAAALLGISEEDVETLQRNNKILSVVIDGIRLYPRGQFDDISGGVVPGIASVVEALANQNPWITLEFLITPDSVLGGIAPLNALRRGGEMRHEVERQVRVNVGDGFA